MIMGFRYRKRIKLLPGIYLNIGTKSMSLSFKAGPVSRTYSTTSRTTTSVNLPGGASYRTSHRRRPTAAQTARDERREELRGRLADARERRDQRRGQGPADGAPGQPWE